MRTPWWQVLPLLAVSDVVTDVPWSPEPPRYRVDVDSNITSQTLTLYRDSEAVMVDVMDTLLARLASPTEGRVKWTVVEIYDYTCPHCWYAVPVYLHVAEAYAENTNVAFTSLNCHLRYNFQACFLLQTIARVADFPTFLACPPMDSVDMEAQLKLSGQAHSIRNQLPKHHPIRKAVMTLAHCRIKFKEEHAKSGLEDPFLSASQLAAWVEKTTGEKALVPADLTIGANFHRKAPVSAIAPPGRPGWLRDDESGRPGVSRYFPGERWYDALMGFVAFVYQGYQPSKLQPTLEVTRYLSMAFPVKGKELAQLADALERRGSDILPSEARKVIQKWSIDVGLGDPDYEAGDEVAGQEHFNGLVKRGSLNAGGMKSLQSLTCPQSSTCNLWNLLHVTVGCVAARGFSGRTLLGDGSILSHGGDGGMALKYQEPDIGVREAQAFVRTFVDNFLNCKQCRERFIWDYDQCNYGRCDYKDWQSLPLWLWRVHNAVNLHVASHSHSPVDRRWPEYQDCPRCWKQELVLGDPVRLLSEQPDAYDQQARSESRWSAGELDLPFHLEAVFWHLISTFVGVGRIVFSLDDFHGVEREEVKHLLKKEGIDPRSVDHSHPSGPKPSPRPIGSQVAPTEVPLPRFRGAADPLQTINQSESSHSAQSIFLALLAMASGVAIVICYFGQDTMEGSMDVEDLEERDFGREARAPMFRAGGGSQGAEAEVELVKDAMPGVGDERVADAAE